LRVGQQDQQVGEHAWQQFVFRVGQGRANQQVARVLIDLGVDRAEAGREGLARVGGHLHQHLLAQAQARQRLLWDVEVDVQAGQILQGGNHRAGGQVLADVHLANADGATERRVDAFLDLLRLELFNHRLIAPVLGGQAIEFTAGDGGITDQLAAATEVDLGQPQVGLGSAEQGGFLVVVELQQRLPGFDLLPGVEVQGLDDALHFQAQFDALQGLEAADGRQALLPLALFGRGGRNSDGWPGRREHLDLLVDREALVAPQGQHDQQNDSQHDEHAAA